MKRILIISDLFYPNNIIGALRPTKIAKALTAKGYTVDVFTRYRVDPRLIADNGICTHLYGFQDAPKACAPEAPSAFGRLKKNLRQNHPALFGRLKKLTDFTYYRDTVRDARSMEQALIETFEKQPAYDVAFSTFGPLSSVLCGLRYKKLHPETRWICDFRDPMVSKHVPHFYRSRFQKLQDTACREADAIIAVSNGYLERICKGSYADKSCMIPNGYDLQDAPAAGALEKYGDRFTISYVGALYGGDRDLSPLFRAIQELIQEHVISEDSVRLAYAGDEADTFFSQAKKYHVDPLVQNFGILSRKDCLKLQFQSHMLVLSTWNDETDYGVFPGKLLEYMLIGSPILSLTCGSRPEGEVTRVIREGRLGIAYEQARDSRDYPQLKACLKESYRQWKTQGTLEFHPDAAVLERYNYSNIIQRIQDLIES